MAAILDAENAWCFCAVDSAGLLVDADQYYRSFYAAASQAKRSILLCGWQFDSDMELLRGAEAEAAALPVRLREFLNALCERNSELEIRVLACAALDQSRARPLPLRRQPRAPRLPPPEVRGDRRRDVVRRRHRSLPAPLGHA